MIGNHNGYGQLTGSLRVVQRVEVKVSLRECGKRFARSLVRNERFRQNVGIVAYQAFSWILCACGGDPTGLQTVLDR